MKFSKIVVFILFLTVIVFTAVVFYFSWHYRAVPDILINRFFIAMLGEAGVLGAIKVVETVFEYRNKMTDLKLAPEVATRQQVWNEILAQLAGEEQEEWEEDSLYDDEVAWENEGEGLDPEESPDSFEQIFPKGG